MPKKAASTPAPVPLYDAFICHASEDKDDFVRPLARRLRDERTEVWFDEFTVRVGDSLRRSIDQGMARSRYGIVVLSPAFFGKGWPQWELDGLVQRETASSQATILPIWYGVTRDEVAEYSLPLADKFAISAENGLDHVVTELLRVLRPGGSALLIARDILLDYGASPPVVTDDWWLDAAASSATNPNEGDFQEDMGWGWWGFPLPERSEDTGVRGERLAWAAMQMMWQEAAAEQRITQVTPPEVVLRFIDAQPGLAVTCTDFPHYLLAYAPQLAIPGFGGRFESIFDDMLARSVERHARERSQKSKCGSGLTTNRLCPASSELLSLRHPTFGDYQPASVACNFVQGDIFGPEVMAYDPIDYLAWLLSAASAWLPAAQHEILLRGMKEWAVWEWAGATHRAVDRGFVENESTGQLLEELLDLASVSKSEDGRLSKAAARDLETRLAFSSELLGLPETGAELAAMLLEEGFVEAWRRERKKRVSSGRTRKAARGPVRRSC